MLGELLAYLHNYFIKETRHGSFAVTAGRIDLDGFVLPAQYYRISGSIFNDGVYKRGAERHMTDETFEGEISALAVPPELLALAGEIVEWIEHTDTGGLASESFGGYSYTAPTGADGLPLTWQAAFASRLARWRKI